MSEDEFFPEKIIGHRYNPRKCRMEYRIQWWSAAVHFQLSSPQQLCVSHITLRTLVAGLCVLFRQPEELAKSGMKADESWEPANVSAQPNTFPAHGSVLCELTLPYAAVSVFILLSASGRLLGLARGMVA